MLRYPARFALGYAGAPERVKEGRFAMVDVAHYGHYRRPKRVGGGRVVVPGDQGSSEKVKPDISCGKEAGMGAVWVIHCKGNG